MTAKQAAAVKGLRKAIWAMDGRDRNAVAPGKRRRFKTWAVRREGAYVVVDSVVGWPGHPFDDIVRTVRIDRAGRQRGLGNCGHGRAGIAEAKGPKLLYELNAQRIY